MRELPEFRGQCGRAFTQYEQIRHIRGNLKLMTEATCSESLIGGTRHCASGQPSYGERQLMLPWMLLWRGGYFTQTATGGEVSLSLSSGISWRKIHVKQAPAMAVVTILDNILKWSDGVNYRRVKTCWLCCTHCWIKEMFSSYHAFVEYEYCTKQV